MEAREISINGIVQGVGFRPHVACRAQELGICGWVINSVNGVRIHAEAPGQEALNDFERVLKEKAPQAARIISFTSKAAQPYGCSSFSIRASDAKGAKDTLVSPDLATCDECLAELFDEGDARYHYPFVNCTNCGPRFTIIEDLPYDRAVTSMRSFTMCPSCAAEYADQTDRRYHAQPDACFECGPRLWWMGNDPDAPGATMQAAEIGSTGELLLDRQQISRENSDAMVEQAAAALADGALLAIKGLGGWHLSCDAENQEAVARLRERKMRPDKPLAVMVRDVDQARGLARVGEQEEALLESAARPIVLLRRLEGCSLAPNIAAGVEELGIMLPSTPLQHLLMRLVEAPLVMTSGNRSGEPIAGTDEQALDALSPIVDGFLGNNRAIVARYDDSVVRVGSEGQVQLVRRARGYAPTPLFVDAEHALPPHAKTIFAAGPEQKSTFAFLKGDRVHLSQHLGDLERLGAWRAWQQTQNHYGKLFDLQAETIACDMHPEYLASKWARKRAQETGAQLVEVQHHHAHIASVLGENSLDGPVLGIALDGTGYGDDGTIWGGELLLADRLGYKRLWHLPPFALPGGAAAVKNPERSAYALLKAGRKDTDPLLAGLSLDNPQWAAFLNGLDGRELLDRMIEQRINSPLCSSAGRLFDAVAALLGICAHPSYDGQAACLLEAQALRELASRGLSVREWAARGAALPCADAPLTALSFHERIVQAIIDQCETARAESGIGTVALSGGCMVNRLLFGALNERLSAAGFTVASNRELPPNDGCIAYGQAIVAAERVRKG